MNAILIQLKSSFVIIKPTLLRNFVAINVLGMETFTRIYIINVSQMFEVIPAYQRVN